MLPLSLTSRRSPNSFINPHTLPAAHCPTSFFRFRFFECFSYFFSSFYKGLECFIPLSTGCYRGLRGRGLILFLFHLLYSHFALILHFYNSDFEAFCFVLLNLILNSIFRSPPYFAPPNNITIV